MTSKRFAPLEHVSSWRRIALAMWQEHTSPQVLGFDEIDMTAILALLERVRDAGERVTVTHVVVKALAQVLARHPELNVVLRRGRIERRRHVDIFVQVAVRRGDSPGRADLSGVQIREVERKSVREVASELQARVGRVRGGDDPDIERIKGLLDRVPAPLLGRIMRATARLSFDLGMDLDALGVKLDPFGVAMVTNCAGFGIRNGFAPLLPMARSPIILLLGETQQRPVVREGQVVVRPVMVIGGTFDHRLFDGFQIGLLSRELREILESERELDALLDA